MNTQITELVLSFLAVLIILTIHEFSHGYVAYKLGDPTAKNQGRLTLNPLKHLDPIGTVCLVFFHFGWAKPVPVDLRYLKKPKRDFALIALAGPISNLIMAFISAFIYLLTFALLRDVSFTDNFTFLLAQNSLKFIYIFHIINVGLAIFNLIPIPPLDGSRILALILPPKAYYNFLKYERKIYLALIIWLFLGSLVSSVFMRIPLVYQNPILSFIVKIFSLSDLLSYAFSFISDLMLKFWQLIPFLKV